MGNHRAFRREASVDSPGGGRALCRSPGRRDGGRGAPARLVPRRIPRPRHGPRGGVARPGAGRRDCHRGRREGAPDGPERNSCTERKGLDGPCGSESPDRRVAPGEERRGEERRGEARRHGSAARRGNRGPFSPCRTGMTRRSPPSSGGLPAPSSSSRLPTGRGWPGSTSRAAPARRSAGSSADGRASVSRERARS